MEDADLREYGIEGSIGGVLGWKWKASAVAPPDQSYLVGIGG